MYNEGFYEGFANALGLDDHVSKLVGTELRWINGPEDVVVAALVTPITISVQKDPRHGLQSSEDDDSKSDE